MLRRKNEKYIIFTVSIEKEVKRIDKNGEELTKYMPYILHLIDSARFMASSSSNPVNNISEGIHRIKCKYRHDDQKCETCRIKCKYCNYFLTNLKDDSIEDKCLYFYQKLFSNISKYKFSNHDNNKFIYVFILMHI